MKFYEAKLHAFKGIPINLRFYAPLVSQSSKCKRIRHTSVFHLFLAVTNLTECEVPGGVAYHNISKL